MPSCIAVRSQAPPPNHPRSMCVLYLLITLQHVACMLTSSGCMCQAGAEGDAPAAKKLWGGRFTGKTDPLMEKFNESLPFDKRMWEEDIKV